MCNVVHPEAQKEFRLECGCSVSGDLRLSFTRTRSLLVFRHEDDANLLPVSCLPQRRELSTDWLQYEPGNGAEAGTEIFCRYIRSPARRLQ